MFRVFQLINCRSAWMFSWGAFHGNFGFAVLNKYLVANRMKCVNWNSKAKPRQIENEKQKINLVCESEYHLFLRIVFPIAEMQVEWHTEMTCFWRSSTCVITDKKPINWIPRVPRKNDDRTFCYQYEILKYFAKILFILKKIAFFVPFCLHLPLQSSFEIVFLIFFSSLCSYG